MKRWRKLNVASSAAASWMSCWPEHGKITMLDGVKSSDPHFENVMPAKAGIQ